MELWNHGTHGTMEPQNQGWNHGTTEPRNQGWNHGTMNGTEEPWNHEQWNHMEPCNRGTTEPRVGRR